MKVFVSFLVSALLACDSLAGGGSYFLPATVGQKNTPFEYQEMQENSDHLLHIQRTRGDDGRLFLTANNCFFKRRTNRMIADGRGAAEIQSEGVGLSEFDRRGVNSRESNAYILRWRKGNIAEWGVWLEQPGHIRAQVVTSGESGVSMRMSLDGRQQEFESRIGDDGRPTVAAKLDFEISRAGFHRLQIESLSDGDQLRVHWVGLAGAATENGGVVRKRWRPSASHAQFYASSMGDSARVSMWVMELDAVPDGYGFYGPITTPFGYFGSPWDGKGNVRPTLNFSLWSFGQNQEAPPIDQLSQIIAVGNPRASFGGFTHEGTGAKIRNWNPYQGRSEGRQRLALRIEPGVPTRNYDRYYAYFYDFENSRWQLFGVGEKFVRQRLLNRPNFEPDVFSMRIGSFVEVVGGPRGSRTGVYPRRMRYRGWIMDQDGDWHNIDKMAYGNVNRRTGLTHTRRGLDDDGWFFNETGSWFWRVPEGGNNDFVINENPLDAEDVDFLSSKDLRTLQSVPSAIRVVSADMEGRKLRLKFEVENAGENPSATVFWGHADGRALEHRWLESYSLENEIVEGSNILSLDIGNLKGDEVFLRMLLENEMGRFFSFETYHKEL